MTQEPKKRRGRPPLAPGIAKRHPLNMRTSKDLRDRLEASASASGRSLAQEVEFRIYDSFQHERDIDEIFGGRAIYSLMEMFAEALKIVESETRKSWRRDRETYKVVLGIYASVLWRYMTDRHRGHKPAMETLPMANHVAATLVGGLKGSRTRLLLDERDTTEDVKE